LLGFNLPATAAVYVVDGLGDACSVRHLALQSAELRRVVRDPRGFVDDYRTVRRNIGEWVPQSEPGTSEVISGNEKWLRGLPWPEIKVNLARHTIYIRGKEIPLTDRTRLIVNWV
jgi:hypothetical protein